MASPKKPAPYDQNHPLIVLIKQGDLEGVQSYFQGDPRSGPRSYVIGGLITALSAHRTDIADVLLANGADINETQNGGTIAHRGALYANRATLLYAINRGLDLNARSLYPQMTPFGRVFLYPLLVAIMVERPSVDTVNLLIEHGATLQHRSIDHTLILQRILPGMPAIARAFVRGGQPTAFDDDGRLPGRVTPENYGRVVSELYTPAGEGSMLLRAYRDTGAPAVIDRFDRHRPPFGGRLIADGVTFNTDTISPALAAIAIGDHVRLSEILRTVGVTAATLASFRAVAHARTLEYSPSENPAAPPSVITPVGDMAITRRIVDTATSAWWGSTQIVRTQLFRSQARTLLMLRNRLNNRGIAPAAADAQPSLEEEAEVAGMIGRRMEEQAHPVLPMLPNEIWLHILSFFPRDTPDGV
jgi:hypothetical protein